MIYKQSMSLSLIILYIINIIASSVRWRGSCVICAYKVILYLIFKNDCTLDSNKKVFYTYFLRIIMKREL